MSLCYAELCSPLELCTLPWVEYSRQQRIICSSIDSYLVSCKWEEVSDTELDQVTSYGTISFCNVEFSLQNKSIAYPAVTNILLVVVSDQLLLALTKCNILASVHGRLRLKTPQCSEVQITRHPSAGTKSVGFHPQRTYFAADQFPTREPVHVTYTLMSLRIYNKSH